MSIDARGLIATLEGYCASSGMFETVVGHEPQSAPTRTGLTAAVQFMEMRSCTSGLNSTSVRVELWVRVFTNGLQKPEDDIDPRIMDAADVIFGALCGDFDFGSQARYVDLRGSDGEPLRALAGYITIDKTQFRTVDVVVPVLINDAYAEVQ